MKLRLFGMVLAFLGFLGSLALYGYFKLIQWSGQEVLLPEARIVELPRGASLKQLSDALAEKEVVQEAALFRIWVRFFSDYSRFQAGSYRFEGSVSPQLVAKTMMQGKIYIPVVMEYTIPEGFDSRQTAARLVAKGVGTESEFEQLMKDEEFLKSLNIESPTIEGYLYPATYQFSKMPSPEEVLRKAVEVFWSKLPQGYEEQVVSRGLTLNEAVIFASLIELETPHEDEKPLVSEVIWRRLKAKAALAVDASIIYGINDYNGNLSRRHLQDKSNPYNTRVHRGLPPTPICSPSLSSLAAVLTPSNEGYYYYVVDAEQEGSRHHFSKTLKEHNRYVRKLVRAGRRKSK